MKFSYILSNVMHLGSFFSNISNFSSFENRLSSPFVISLFLGVFVPIWGQCTKYNEHVLNKIVFLLTFFISLAKFLQTCGVFCFPLALYDC